MRSRASPSADVAGVDEARLNWLNPFDFLKKPEALHGDRARIPKGVPAGGLSRKARHSSPRRWPVGRSFLFFIISGSRFRRTLCRANGAARLRGPVRASQEKQRPASSSLTNSMRSANPVPARMGCGPAGNDERRADPQPNAHRDGWLCFHDKPVDGAGRHQPAPNAGCCRCCGRRPLRRQCCRIRPDLPARKNDSRYLCLEGEAGRGFDSRSHRRRPPVAFAGAIWPTLG